MSEPAQPNTGAWPSWFDGAWYLERYEDVRLSGTDPYEHYRLFGESEGRDVGRRLGPAHWPLWFDGEWYRRAFEHRIGAHQDPFDHYVEKGRDGGLPPNRSLRSWPGSALRPPLALEKVDIEQTMAVIAASGLFDAAWYALNYGVRPAVTLRHYVEAGAYMGMNPSLFFDSLDYFALNQDIASYGLNPLGHYIEYGYREGRKASRQERPALDLTVQVWLRGF